ncbi:magnesium transporter [Prescottella equi]|uniref:magnesium transporter n=1 Tax=Rhodococcus hoagii TaxID=43767 RepID=UPI001C779EF8|nr:magnesium transporter [Prescottella equi]BCN58340.1 hypothetical protein RE9427_17100 [Prescottella equi]
MRESDVKALTVILGSGGVSEGVRDVLTDLSAAGLISPFLWVEQTGDASVVGADDAIEVVGGVERSVRLQDVLASRVLDRVRVCVVVPAAAGSVPVGSAFERAVAELVSSNSGGAQVTRMRLLLHRPGDDVSAATVWAPAGWHNLVVAPEDSRGPGMGHRTLQSTADPIDLGRHTAPVLASVAGLWVDVEHAPLDDLPVLPGNALRVVRSYYRRLDTSGAEDELRRRVLDFGGQLPLPSGTGASVVYANDVASATSRMAQLVWSRHRHLLEGRRVAPPPVAPRQEIGLGEAIRVFLSFLGAVIRNAPAALFARVVKTLSSTVASRTENALFGAESAYKLVVNGVDADGRPAGWSEYEVASKRIAAKLDAAAGRAPAAQSATADLSDLWRDFRRGALTLADAGERSPDLPPVQVGAHAAVLRSATDVVPGPADRFTEIPGIVSATIDVHAVDAADVLGISEFSEKLSALEADPTLGLEVRRTNAALRTWADRLGQSYAVAFGGILAQRLSTTLGEVRSLVERIEGAAPPEDLVEVTARRHRKLVRKVQALTLGFAVVAVIAGVLAGADVVSWWTGGTVIALSLLGWCGTVARAFMSEQQQLQRLLAEQEAAAVARETDQENLRAALRDVECQSAAYRQYLSWSRALGAFLANPLGASADARPAGRTVEWGLPLSVVVASSSPEPEQVERLAEQLRHDLLGIGWLSDQWDTLVSNAAGELGASGRDLRRNPALLTEQPGVGSGSALDEWSALLHEGRAEAGGAAVLWERARTELALSGGELPGRIAGVVEFHEDGVVRRGSLGEFLAGVGTDSVSEDRSFFDRSIFTDLASTKGLTAVEISASDTAPAGLGLVAVTTQFTEGIVEEDLRLRAVGPDSQSAPTEVARAFDLPIRPAERSVGQQVPVPAAYAVPVADGLNF